MSVDGGVFFGGFGLRGEQETLEPVVVGVIEYSTDLGGGFLDGADQCVRGTGGADRRGEAAAQYLLGEVAAAWFGVGQRGEGYRTGGSTGGAGESARQVASRGACRLSGDGRADR